MAALLDRLGLGRGRSSEKRAGAAAGGGAGGGGISGGLPSNAPATVDVERLAKLSLFVRAAQVFFAIVMLGIAAGLASFQKKWLKSGMSGLTGFLLFVAAFSLVSSALLAAVPVLNERSSGANRALQSVDRALGEARVGMVVNGFWTALLLLVALIQTISAYTLKGCKDPKSDANAGTSLGKGDDYVAALPGFCRSKRAEAAFVWFLWVSWAATLALFLHQWRLSRKNGPRIPPFVHPAEDSAFEPIHNGGAGGDIDEDDRVDYGTAGGRYGDGGDGRYGTAYDAYGGPTPGAMPPAAAAAYAAPRISYDAPAYRTSYDARAPAGVVPAAAAGNPFTDSAAAAAPRPSYDYGAYGGGGGVAGAGLGGAGIGGAADPYSAIQAQLAGGGRTAERPPQLPELPSYR